jgi:tRNA pseudouridine55 synthase
VARKKKGEPISGWVNLDKPYAMTSTQAVAKVRHIFSAQKAGHAGTLDPLASGILPIALGEATKTVPYLMDSHKTYRFSIAFGTSTTTLDAEGGVTQASDARPSLDAITQVLPRFVGEISQTPPAFSAIKVNGERAYDLARAGLEFELAPRLVTIFSLELAHAENSHATLLMRCSKGTYVRSLMRDICDALGVCGHVSALRREAVGAFDTATTIGLDKLIDLGHRGVHFEALLKVETALDDIPGYALTSDEAQRIRQGQDIALMPQSFDPLKEALDIRTMRGYESHSSTVRLGAEDRLLAMAELRGHRLYPVRLFNLQNGDTDVDYA